MNQRPGREVELPAALLLLERMGISVEGLPSGPVAGRVVSTFAEYVPVAAAALLPGTRKAFGSYWNRGVEHWGQRHLDEPTPSAKRCGVDCCAYTPRPPAAAAAP